MLFLILSLLVQAAFIVHVIKTGRNQLWIWVLIIPGLALAGILSFLVGEILPGLFRRRAAQRAGPGPRQALGSQRGLRPFAREGRVPAQWGSRHALSEGPVGRG